MSGEIVGGAITAVLSNDPCTAASAAAVPWEEVAIVVGVAGPASSVAISTGFRVGRVVGLAVAFAVGLAVLTTAATAVSLDSGKAS